MGVLITTARRVIRPRRAASDEGFSLVEALVALSLLAMGLLSLAAVFTMSLKRMNNTTWDILAKEKASEAIENILAARDEGRIDWEELNNTTAGDGIFKAGPQPLLDPGPDRLVNTEDDVNTPLQLRRPGADGQLLTDDDEFVDLSAFKREIKIEPVGGGGTLREVRVIITYTGGGATRQFQMRSYLSSFTE